MNKKARPSSGPLSGSAGFLRVHASAFQLLSPGETLFSCRSACVFIIIIIIIFRHKLLNFNLSEPPNSFFLNYITYVFFFNFFNHKPSSFRRWSMNVVNFLEIFCMHVCIIGRTDKLQILFLGCLKKP